MSPKILSYLEIEASIANGQSGQMAFDDFSTSCWIFLSKASRKQLNIIFKYFNKYPSPNFANCHDLIMQSITGLDDYSIYKTQ